MTECESCAGSGPDGARDGGDGGGRHPSRDVRRASSHCCRHGDGVEDRRRSAGALCSFPLVVLVFILFIVVVIQKAVSCLQQTNQTRTRTCSTQTQEHCEPEAPIPQARSFWLCISSLSEKSSNMLCFLPLRPPCTRCQLSRSCSTWTPCRRERCTASRLRPSWAPTCTAAALTPSVCPSQVQVACSHRRAHRSMFFTSSDPACSELFLSRSRRCVEEADHRDCDCDLRGSSPVLCVLVLHSLPSRRLSNVFPQRAAAPLAGQSLP